jgi:glycosyltransferase involved in cell wall biosynthesis
VDLVLCTYGRLEELRVSVADALASLGAARQVGVSGTLVVVYQEADLPSRLLSLCPEWRDEPALRLVFSSPPSLTRARNVGVQETQNDLVIFIDDDVSLEPSFVTAHLAAANGSPTAWGVAGRVRSQRDGLLASGSLAVGQIRASGNVESHFESIRDQVPLVPQTALGANMSYKRRAMTEAFGQRWFDESLQGSAFREETTLGLAILRHGGHLVFGPDAVLTHFQSESGGCDNRKKKTIAQRSAQAVLEYRFLARLYELNPLLRILAPWQLGARDTFKARSLGGVALRAFVNLRGYLGSLRG